MGREGLTWPALLDVLEERTKQLEAVVDTGGGELGPGVPLQAQGPLPAELAPRVRALLAETQRVEQRAALRTARAERALRYGQL